jgi:hypothetical protein
MNYKRLFFDFLRKKGALEAYKRNFKEYRGSTSFNDVFSQNCLYGDCIIGAFSWIRTPEGHWYWRRLQDEWYTICHKYKQMKRFNS